MPYIRPFRTPQQREQVYFDRLQFGRWLPPKSWNRQSALKSRLSTGLDGARILAPAPLLVGFGSEPVGNQPSFAIDVAERRRLRPSIIGG